jgi:hypothetical protein
MDSCGSTLHRPVAVRRRNARPGSSGSASSARYQGGVPQAALWSWDRHGQTPDLVLARLGSSSCLTCLIIRLIIQTIRRDPSGSDRIDDAPNVSRPDPSGPDQIDAEHQATDLAVGVPNPSRRATWWVRQPQGREPLALRRRADRSCCLVRVSAPGRRATGEAPGAARGATDAREVRDLWSAVQNEQRPGLARPRGAPETPDASGQGRARRGPHAHGRWRRPGRRAAATRGRRARARPDRCGASRSPVVAQAVGAAVTGTPVGAG